MVDRRRLPRDRVWSANRGLCFIDAPDLARYVRRLDALDFQVHVHALGDRARLIGTSVNGARVFSA